MTYQSKKGYKTGHQVHATSKNFSKAISLNDNRPIATVQRKQIEALAAKPNNSLQFNSQVTTTAQLMSKEAANKSVDNEEIVWYKMDGSYKRVRIAEKVKDNDQNVNIFLNGTIINVELSALHAKKKGESLLTNVADKGVELPGPSRPVPDEPVIHRGEVETEMVNGVTHVRVYSALMSSVGFASEDPETGMATSTPKDDPKKKDGKIFAKDIHQHKSGRITISTGANSLLWAGMGRPLRVLKWSEKYFAQILTEEPKLKPVYEQYKLAVSQLEILSDELQRHQKNLAEPTTLLERNSAKWAISKRTKNQQASLNLQQKKIDKINTLINEVNIKINREQKTIDDTRKLLGKDANPVIRSFLIPFASYEKISKRALPERLSGVTSDAEKAVVKWETEMDELMLELQKVSENIKHYSDLKSKQESKEAACKMEVKRINQLKSPNQKLLKRRNLRDRQADDAKQTKLHYQDLLKMYLEKRIQLEVTVNKIKKPIISLAERAMPDLDLSQESIQKIIEEMKKRNLLGSSMNVDLHYEPNQFGVRGGDLEILRQDAVPGSLITYAKFPETMERDRKAESGNVQDINVLRHKLGVPEKELNTSQWISGDDFAKQHKFKGEADRLAELYGTWLAIKNPKFNEDAFLAKDNKKPLKRRKEMLIEFLTENGIRGDKVDEFMEKVVGPWASQSMIAHIIAHDYDQMNADQNITAKVGTQNFEKMRNDLPLAQR